MSARQDIAAGLQGVNPYTLDLALWRATWLDTARPQQLPPNGEWLHWLILAGRGFGKTRTGAEETGYQAAANPRTRWAVIGPTQDDVRSVCFEGESGLLNVVPPRFLRGGDRARAYNSQKLELHFANGSLIAGKSAEKPDRLRGPQWHGAWCDELASWGASAAKGKPNSNRLQDTWDNLLFGLRLGDRPRVIVTTTPRPLEFLRTMVKDADCHVTTGSTFDNMANLAGSALATFKRIYEGTRRGQQELYGVILDNAEGALWNAAMLENRRPDIDTASLVRIVVAIDPAVTTEENSDETGIIVCGVDGEGRVYVLEDLSGKYRPREWARVALAAYQRFSADSIVAESNQGGDLVEANLRAEAGNTFFAFKKVHAKRGKYLRAEPVAAFYEKGMVHHTAYFPELEKQMMNFVGFTGDSSPDRLDALVYGVGELMLGQSSHAFW